MPRYRMLIAYDGTDYHGWQWQPEVPTITGVLKSKFKRVFNRNITLVGASRTDQGVHALGQVASFYLGESLPLDRMLYAWNNVLPKDIFIRSLEEAPERFHPMMHVREKTYYYHFFQQRPLPFLIRYGYRAPKLDLNKLQQALKFFVGTHDFRSFCTGYEKKSTIRTIHSIDLKNYSRFGVYRIAVTGPGFLKYMIRRLVGACFQVASEPYAPLDQLKVLLEVRNPHHHHSLVAPPQGLVL